MGLDDLELPMTYDIAAGYSLEYGSTAHWSFSQGGKRYGAVCCSQTSANKAMEMAFRNMAEVFKTAKQLEET